MIYGWVGSGHNDTKNGSGLQKSPEIALKSFVLRFFSKKK